MNQNFKDWILGKDCQKIREWFFPFYIAYVFVTILYKLFPTSRLFYLMTCAVTVIYSPIIIFAFGYLVGEIHTNRKDSFKKILFKLALCNYILYITIGFIKEITLEGCAIYATVKDFFAFIRIPGITAIFLTIFFWSIILAFLSDKIDQFIARPYIIALICVIGLAFSLIPANLVGYGLYGVFVGGDKYGCIPIATHMLAFCWGFYDSKTKDSPDRRKEFAVAAICILLCVVALVLHQKKACYILAGTACAYIISVVGIWILPVYAWIEDKVVSVIHACTNVLAKLNRASKQNRKVELLIYYLIYAVCTVAIMYMIFEPYREAFKSLIWKADGLGQYVPKVYRFLNYIPGVVSDIMHGNFDFQQYDFSSGLGGTVTFAFDPIYWLYLLFNPSQVETAYNFLIYLRFFLAGMSMSAMLLYFKKPKYATFLGSMAYTFSGYAIFGGTRHGQFLTPLILFPLLIIAMEQLIKFKKWYLMTILVALSLLCSYYFLYMNTIALGIYYVTRILCTKEYRNFKTFFFRGLLIVWSYVLGSCMGIMSLFLSFGSYLGSSRASSASSSIFTNTILFYRPEWLSDTFIAFISDDFTPGLWLKLGFVPLALFAIVFLFTRKNKKELRPLFLILTFFLTVPVFGYIFSGFSSVNNRWSYIYATLIVFIYVETIGNFEDLKKNEIVIMVAMTMVYFLVVMFSTKYKIVSVMGAFGLLSGTTLVIVFINQRNIPIPKKLKRASLFAISIICILINSNLFINSESEDGTHLDTYVDSGTAYTQITNTPLKYLDQVEDTEDSDFYRATNSVTTGILRMSSMVVGYNDVSTFNSTLSGGIVDYNALMGNSRWNIVSISDYNRRTIMNELASVKYIGVNDKYLQTIPYGYKLALDNVNDNKHWSIYENEYALPLGYTYSKVISESEVSDCSPAEKQDITMQAAIVKDNSDTLDSSSDIQTVDIDSLPVTAHEIEVKDIELHDCHMYGDGTQPEIDEEIKSIDLDDTSLDTSKLLVIDEDDASITLTMDYEADSETYLAIDGDIYHKKDATEYFIDTYVNADDVSNYGKFRIDSYSTHQGEYLYNLGYHEDSTTKTITINFTGASEKVLQINRIFGYSQPMGDYATNVAALKENSLQNAKAEKNTVTGQITVDQDKMLVISLPYQKGWTAYVDGEKVPIQEVNYQYMGIELTKGSHDIRLHYQLPGIKYGFLITIAGFAVFLLIIIVNIIRKRIVKR